MPGYQRLEKHAWWLHDGALGIPVLVAKQLATTLNLIGLLFFIRFFAEVLSHILLQLLVNIVCEDISKCWHRTAKQKGVSETDQDQPA